MIAIRSAVQNRVSAQLTALGWTDADLARAIGTTRSRMNRLKNGRLPWTVRDALLVSEALGAPVSSLFRLVEDRCPKHSS